MEDTTVLTGEVITMERDKLKMNPLPQDQTPMLTPRLMAGVSFTVMTKSDLIDNALALMSFYLPTNTYPNYVDLVTIVIRTSYLINNNNWI